MEEKKAKAQKEAVEKELNAYTKLAKLGDNKALNDFLDLIIKTTAEKMVWTFTGDNIKSWEDFLKVRGEIVSYLFPIQEIRGAKAMQQHLREQLDTYYKNVVE